METIYNVDYFINKFEPILEELWTIKAQFDNGRSCAFGHCNRDRRGLDNPEYAALLCLSEKVAEKCLQLTYIGPHDYKYNGAIANINNGFFSEYQQPTPKQRVLAALRDIKASQEKAQQSEVIERIVYVLVDAPVRELQRSELIEN